MEDSIRKEKSRKKSGSLQREADSLTGTVQLNQVQTWTISQDLTQRDSFNKTLFFLLQVFLAWKEVCFDRIDKVRKSVQFFLPPSEPPMFKPSQLPTPVSRYQGKVSRKSSVLAWTSQCEPHGHWSKSCVLLLQYSARWIFYWTYFGLYVYVWLGYYCVLVFKYEEDCLMCQHSSQYIYKLTVCTSCATF